MYIISLSLILFNINYNIVEQLISSASKCSDNEKHLKYDRLVEIWKCYQ